MSKINPNDIVKKQDFNGQEFLVEEKKGRWLDEMTYLNPDGSISTKDPNMVVREFHNQSNEDVFFKKQYPHLMGAELIGVKPDHFCILPHAYYIGYTKSGRPIKGNMIFGSAMFKHTRGNK